MSTKAEFQRFVIRKLLTHSETTHSANSELVSVIRKHRRILRYTPGLMTALVEVANQEAVGAVDTSPDTEPLRDKLPPKVGEKKAGAWTVRASVGESCEKISSNTHSTDAETVAASIEVAAPYIGFESEDTSTE